MPYKQTELFALAALLTLAATITFAAESDANTSSNPASSGLLIGLLIVYLTRRRKIGGWLLYYYIQTYGALVITAVTLTVVVPRFSPAAWNQASQYVWYLLSTAPGIAGSLIEVATATYLLIRRNEGNLKRLQLVLAWVAGIEAASLGIDSVYFNDVTTLVLDVITVFFSVVWVIYFRQSRRVRQVFVTHNWNYEEQIPKTPQTPQEVRYLRKRTLIWTSAAFVILLVAMGLSIGDKKPDAGIFVVPIFYSVLVAALGWWLPISKNKRAELNAPAANSER